MAAKWVPASAQQFCSFYQSRSMIGPAMVGERFVLLEPGTTQSDSYEPIPGRSIECQSGTYRTPFAFTVQMKGPGFTLAFTIASRLLRNLSAI